MSSIEGNHVTDWLPGFVLDALGNEEMHQVSEHLAVCPACQAELARLQQVLDELPLAVKQTDPPPGLKLNLMQTIRSRKASPVLEMEQISFRQRFAIFIHSRWPAFGLAVIIVLVLANLLLWQRLVQATQHASTPLRVVNLTSSQHFPGAVGALVIDSNSLYGTLVVDNLTVLDPDKQYQVWLIKGAEHYSAGVFSVNSDGYASVQIQSPQLLQIYDAIGVSVEPAGGSAAPAGENVFHAFLVK